MVISIVMIVYQKVVPLTTPKPLMPQARSVGLLPRVTKGEFHARLVFHQWKRTVFSHMVGSINGASPKNGWFLLGKIPFRNGWLGGTPISGNHHILVFWRWPHTHPRNLAKPPVEPRPPKFPCPHCQLVLSENKIPSNYGSGPGCPPIVYGHTLAGQSLCSDTLFWMVKNWASD